MLSFQTSTSLLSSGGSKRGELPTWGNNYQCTRRLPRHVLCTGPLSRC